MPKFVLLWTDAAIWLLVAAAIGYILLVRRRPNLVAAWRKVFGDAPALASFVVLLVGVVLTLADSVHFRAVLPAAAGAPAGSVAYDTRTQSLLDASLRRLIDTRETTYSRPLAYRSFTRESMDVNGRVERIAPRLKFGGAHLNDPDAQWGADVALRFVVGIAGGVVAAGLIGAALIAGVAR